MELIQYYVNRNYLINTRNQMQEKIKKFITGHCPIIEYDIGLLTEILKNDDKRIHWSTKRLQHYLKVQEAIQIKKNKKIRHPLTYFQDGDQKSSKKEYPVIMMGGNLYRAH